MIHGDIDEIGDACLVLNDHGFSQLLTRQFPVGKTMS